jgi:hypothetical protein
MCEFGVLDVFDCTPTEPHGLTTLLYRRQPPSGVTPFGSLRFASLRHPRGGSFKDVALFQFTETFLHSQDNPDECLGFCSKMHLFK